MLVICSQHTSKPSACQDLRGGVPTFEMLNDVLVPIQHGTISSPSRSVLFQNLNENFLPCSQPLKERHLLLFKCLLFEKAN